MSTTSWNGATGDWSNAVDWSNGVPNSSTTDAVITASGSYTVSIGDPASSFAVGSLNLGAAGATLAVTGALFVTGNFSQTAGTLHIIGPGPPPPAGYPNTLPGHKVVVNGGLVNKGQITIDALSFFVVDGNYTLANLGTITNNGTLTLNGTLLNQGLTTTLGVGPLAGNTHIASIQGGTVIGDATTSREVGFNGITVLDGVTLQGQFNVGIYKVVNGLTVAPGAALTVGQNAGLEFSGSQTFDNTVLSLGGVSGSRSTRQALVGTDSTLTLGAHLTIINASTNGASTFAVLGETPPQFGSPNLPAGGVTVINNGLIEAQSAGGFFTFNPSQFVNNGSVQISNKDTVALINGLGQSLQSVLSGTGQFTLATGGVLNLQTVAAGQTIRFNDATGVLRLDTPGAFKALIAGFAAGDTITLVATAATSAKINASDQLVITNNGAAVARLQLSGNYSAATFKLASDGFGGEVITVSGGATAPAFAQAIASFAGSGAGPVAASSHDVEATRGLSLAVSHSLH